MLKNGDLIEILPGCSGYPVGKWCRYIDIDNEETDLYNPNGANHHWWINPTYAKAVSQQLEFSFMDEI